MKNDKRHELTDDQFDLIKDMLPGREGTVGPTVDNRNFLNAIFWYLKTGSPWRDLPKPYGAWKSVHRRFTRWSKKGVFQKIFAVLVKNYGTSFESIQIDSTTVKSHQHSATTFKKNTMSK